MLKREGWMPRIVSVAALGLVSAAPAAAQVTGPPPAPMPPPDAAASPSPAPMPPPDATAAPAPMPPSPGPAPAVSAVPAAPPPGWEAGPGATSPQPAAGPAPAPRPPSRLGHGLTFEISLGLGWLRFANPQGDPATEDALGGLNLGLGFWLSSHNALSLRLAGATHAERGVVQVTGGFLGPALQHWFDESAWMGVGVGLGMLTYKYEDARLDPEPETGLGLDLRVGYRFIGWGQNALSASLEVTPVLLENSSVTGLGLLLAYQYL